MPSSLSAPEFDPPRTETLPELKRNPNNNDEFDVIVIGLGPAGMSAAICCARADLNVLVIEKALPGGSCSTAYKINNFIGFPGGIFGEDLSERMESQLFEYPIAHTCENVENILNPRESKKAVQTDLGHIYYTKSIIIAHGLEPKQLNAPFESQFMGRGVSYFAGGDADFYKGADVMVIGTGNCACYAAEHLSTVANKVYLLCHFDYLKAVSSLKKNIEENPKIDIIWDSDVEQVFGIDRVEKAQIVNRTTQQHTWIDVKGVFIYIGRIPPQDFLCADIEVDEQGFIVTDEYMRSNIPGIYAAGDIRSKQVRQIATAVSDGMIAGINVERDFFRQ